MAFRLRLNQNHFKRQVVKIAVTSFNDQVAPCFAATRCLQIWEIYSDNSIRQIVMQLGATNSLERIKLLAKHGINVLICNGIENQNKRLLEASNCHVIEGITGPVDSAFYGYVSGDVVRKDRNACPQLGILHQNSDRLINETEELFTRFDWEVHRQSEICSYPVDLHASKDCPICRKTIRVGICCGLHSCNVESEIREFNLSTIIGYHGKVLIQFPSPEIVDKCESFGIEIIDPTTFKIRSSMSKSTYMLPPLKGRISDHEQINSTPEIGIK